MTTQPNVLVTGSTAGIGKATAFQLARSGARVFASGRSPEKLARLAAEAESLGLRLTTVALDVTDAETIAAARAEVLSATDGHGLDVLVNNAGYAESGPVDALTPAKVRAQFETNVFGMIGVTHAFLPEMIARGAGRVVNVSSVAAHMAIPFFGAYAATKHAIHALSAALRIELADRGVHVAEIEPGWVRTDFTRLALNRVDGLGEAESDAVRAMRKARDLESRVYLPMSPPEKVARTIVRAATARHPHACYRLPLTTSIMLWMVRLTPPPVLEWFYRVTIRYLATGRLRRPRR